jgi:hypothetical protein
VFLLTKTEKIVEFKKHQFFLKYCNIFFLRLPWRTSKLQEKPPAFPRKYPVAEFLDVIGTKVFRVLFSSLHFTAISTTDFTPSPPPPQIKSGLKLVCNVKIVYGNLKIMPRNLNEIIR